MTGFGLTNEKKGDNDVVKNKFEGRVVVPRNAMFKRAKFKASTTAIGKPSVNHAVTTHIEIPTVILSVPHTHDPNPESVAASRMKSTTKNISGTSRGTLTQIFVDTTATGTTEIRAALGNPELVKRTLRRERAKHLPPNPQSIQDLDLEDYGL